jgi:hypothetical protein
LYLQQYFRAGRDLTATYNFLNGHTIQNQKNYRNNLLIDLNAGPHPNAFATTVGNMTAVFGYNQSTSTGLTRRVGRGGQVLPLTTSPSGFLAHSQPTQPGQVWYNPRYTTLGGDGVVPIKSLVSTFVGDPHVTLMPLAGVTHVTVLTDPTVQDTLISILSQQP